MQKSNKRIDLELHKVYFETLLRTELNMFLVTFFGFFSVYFEFWLVKVFNFVCYFGFGFGFGLLMNCLLF